MGKIALVQMVSCADVVNNLNQIETLMIQAADEQAELVVLPENCAFMGMNEFDKVQIAEVEHSGPIQTHLSNLAKKLKLWLIAGTIPIIASGSKVRSSSIVYDDRGKQVARYDKIHLFDVKVSEHESHHESLTVEPGCELVVVQTPVGAIGLSVCYDLRFPELYQKLLFKGAELFTIPSAFTQATGKAHWDMLIRSRAVENLCYVLAPNQGGHHDNGRDTYGHSMVVDPWGSIITDLHTGPGVITADIEIERVHKLRKEFPCVDHHVLI